MLEYIYIQQTNDLKSINTDMGFGALANKIKLGNNISLIRQHN